MLHWIMLASKWLEKYENGRSGWTVKDVRARDVSSVE